jgi:phosphoglycerate dehydrogenase-like enzyme
VPAKERISIAVLDDYQGVASQMADWSVLQGRAGIKIFRDHLSDPKAIIQRLKPFDVICVMRERTPLPRAILEKLPRLRLIASTGRFNHSIDMVAAKELGITVCGTGSKESRSYGADELTWALILALFRNLIEETQAVKRGEWQTTVGNQLHGKTMGILGLGKIGSTTARVAGAFGMNVIAWSPNLTGERAEELGAKLVTKDELFLNSDVVSIHMVLSDKTRGIVGARELGLMKKTAYLVNTSRGPLVDERALVRALRNKRIAGAGLDVFDTEPLPKNHLFRTLENVVATPHEGFVTKESYKIFYGDTVENIIAWLDGKPIRVIDV